MTNVEQAGIANGPIRAGSQEGEHVKAYIIDDAYDPPIRAELNEEINEFWTRVVRDDSVMEELSRLKPDIFGETDIDDELLASLWEQIDTFSKLKPLLYQLFASKIEGITPLHRLDENLQRLGVEPVAIRSDQDFPNEPAKLIFIDYFLGQGEAGRNAAVAKAKEVYDQFKESNNKPYIVLMSSKPDVEAAKEAFRQESGLLGGLFSFFKKEELKDPKVFDLHWATWATDMAARYNIQHFVEAIESAVEEAKDDFVQRVRALGFEDYANIQSLSLKSDGHPLGNYMLWLYKSLFSYLLHSNPKVLEQEKKLNALSLESYIPSEFLPSLELARIYSYALTEPGVDAVGPHPGGDDENNKPFLHLGDLFFRDGTLDVLIVINAACDIACAPRGIRDIPNDRSIFLMHGRLQPYEERDTPDLDKTELFHYNDKVYRILWDSKRVTSIDYGGVNEWLNELHYKRKARLALPYALQVQQMFGMKLMRIGMPVKPPIFFRADVEGYCEDENKNSRKFVGPVSNGAILFNRLNDKKEECYFALTRECVGKIVESLDNAHELLRGNIDALINQRNGEKESAPQDKVVAGKIKGINTKLEKLELLKSEMEKWKPLFSKLTPLPTPATLGNGLENLLNVYRDRTVEDPYKGNTPIILNIITKTSSEIDTVVDQVAEVGAGGIPDE